MRIVLVRILNIWKNVRKYSNNIFLVLNVETITLPVELYECSLLVINSFCLQILFSHPIS